MEGRQFLDDVDLALDIEAPAGNVDEVPLFTACQHRETETSEDAADLNRAEFLAENSLHFPQIELHRSQIKLAGDHIDHVADKAAAARSEYQLCNPVRRSDGQFEIAAALTPLRTVA